MIMNLKPLTAQIGLSVVRITTVGINSSAEMYFKIQEIVYKCHDTSEAECAIDNDLYMKYLRDMNRICDHFFPMD